MLGIIYTTKIVEMNDPHPTPPKTLIGKNGYLFLQNDSADEINVHQNNIDKTFPEYLSTISSLDNIVNSIQPDLVIEFRVERFL